MFKNHLKTAWRNLLKNKLYSSINIAGLTLGLSVGILILLRVVESDRLHHHWHPHRFRHLPCPAAFFL